MHNCDHCYDLGVREGYKRGFDDGAKAVTADLGGSHNTHNTHNTHTPPKKKMKKSPYRKELTRQQRKLAKAHPRMSFKSRSEKAHAATRKKLGIRKKRS